MLISISIQEIQLVQKNKVKEIEDLIDLELNKNECEQELESSLVEIEEMSELVKRLKRVDITENKPIEAEKENNDNINQLEYGKAQHSQKIPNLFEYMKDPPTLDWTES